MLARLRPSTPIGLAAVLLLPGVGAAMGAAGADDGALAALDEGDRAWFRGERRVAVQAWRAASDQDNPAAEAMARLRLLHFSGNWGMAAHGPRIDAALAVCPEEDPWCRLALVDFHLLAPAEVGADPQQALALACTLEGELPGPALARQLMVEPSPAALARLAELPRDGLGDGLLISEGAAPPYAGTWLLGLGLLGGPGLGFGAGVHFVHDDLFYGGHDLALELGATSRGSAWLGAAGASAGTVFGHGDLGVSRWVQDLWLEDQAVTWRVEGASASVGPGLRHGALRVAVGARARWDRVGDLALLGHGPELSLSLDRADGWGGERRGWVLQSGWRSAVRALGADYDHLYGSLELRGYAGLPLQGVLAARALGSRAFLDEAPWYRLPTAGGSQVLRGAPAGRYPGRSLAAADLELRRMIAGPLEGVVFGCGAWLEDSGWHPGGGLGLRLIMPPRERNTVRLDLAFSDAGWAVTTGWGEVF
jgi:hypothetical protein